jgi:hypothetical protein
VENKTASFPAYKLLQEVENIKLPAEKKGILEHCEELTPPLTATSWRMPKYIRVCSPFDIDVEDLDDVT